MHLSPLALRHFNAAATVLWLTLIIPTLTIWRDAIWWIAFMSVWANVASHYTSWQAARAECAATKETT